MVPRQTEYVQVSVDTVFKPIGALAFVDSTVAVIVCPKDGAGQSTYRVKCTAVGYLRWYPSTAGSTPAPIAPTAGIANSQPNTVGMAAGTVETFEIPAGVQFIASTGATFEIMSGQGA